MNYKLACLQLREMDEMRESVEEINRKLHPQPAYGGGSYANGRQNGFNDSHQRGNGAPRRGGFPARRGQFGGQGARQAPAAASGAFGLIAAVCITI